MTAQEINNINDYIHNLNNGDLFSAEPSIDGEYCHLYFNGKKVYEDSSNGDLYTEEGAIGTFESMLNELPERWVPVVKSAMEWSYEPDLRLDLEGILVDAENYLIGRLDDEDCKVDIVTNFWSNPNYLYWQDENNIVCCDQSGEIISNDPKLRSYYRYQNGELTPAKWFENDDESVYTYLDKVVDSKGNVWILLA